MTIQVIIPSPRKGHVADTFRSLSAASRRHALKFIVMKTFLGENDGFVCEFSKTRQTKKCVAFCCCLPVFFQGKNGKNESLLKKNRKEKRDLIKKV